MSARKTEKNTVKSISLPEPKKSSTSGLHLFIILFSVAWFAVVAVYITQFFGWSNLFSMVPNEFGAFLGSITLPLAIIWVIMAYIDRGNNFRHETELLQNSINQVFFPDSNGDAVTKMIADAIKSQVIDLKEATRDVFAQSDVIRRDLVERVDDMRQLSEAITSYATQALPSLAEQIQQLTANFQEVAETASTTTSDFRVNTIKMREDSENMVNLLTPMVNQMVTAAEHVKEVVNVNNDNIARAQEQLQQYSETSKASISQIIDAWAEKGENLERTFLRTAENCQEMFQKLDSSISHIENSIAEQKKVVDTQSAMLDKNSAYLDNKLGEYGKLISLEVEAMVKRSGTLEQNVQAQLKTIRSTADEITDLFNGVGNDIVAKRKQLENETTEVMRNINGTVRALDEELKRLREYYENTHTKNGELSKVFATVADSLRQIESGMAQSLGNFSTKTNAILDQFDSVNKNIGGNIDKMAENANLFTEQSRKNADLLMAQDDYMGKALGNLKQMSGRILSINDTLSETGSKIGETLALYETKMGGFSRTVNRHLEDLSANYDKAKKQIDLLDQKYKTSSIDTFMKSSADILAELEAISIDINGIFNKTDTDEDLWKQYYAGDHGVFVRNLAKNMTKKEIISIREDYESKPDFRVVVDKYLDDFNSLISAARKNNRAGTLLALISGSDIGKVYYVLARALGKIN
ncbi:MAG: methyl-accepting chemotaxis protein [Alphaproteobacteria bacterium]|nr:methyl-accepting chemotaxis protein [Alphaproteobacteria bacterium]